MHKLWTHSSIQEQNSCVLPWSWLYLSQLPLPFWEPTPNTKFLEQITLKLNNCQENESSREKNMCCCKQNSIVKAKAKGKYEYAGKNKKEKEKGSKE